MRLLRSLALGAVLAGGGCAARLPEPQTPTMVRKFNGTLVAGYYVSPSAYQHYIQAQLYSNDGRAEEAAEELRLAIASDGASAYLRTRLAEELLALGRVDEAREEVEAALHLDGQFAEAHVDLARVRMRLGDGGGAEEALKRAIELDRGCVEAYVALVSMYRERGLEARAEEIWQKLARAVPNSAQAHEALGRMAAARDDDKAAESAFSRALELDPALQEARVELAQLYQAQGRVGEAIKLYRETYERSGDTKVAEALVKLQMATGREGEARSLVERLDDEGGSAERRVTVGRLHLLSKRPAGARAAAEEILKGGELASARLLLGDALEADGRFDDAVAELRKVPTTSGDFAAAQKKVAAILRDGGRYHDAIEALGRAIVQVATAQGESAVDGLRDLLAQVHERAGNAREGVRLLEAALAKRPGSSALAFALGAAYMRGGQWEKAVEIVKSVVLRRDPESAQALNFIGYAMAERGVRLDEAKKLLERARALQPTSGEIADSLALVLAKQGHFEQAERLLLRADRLAPDEPEILQHLGDLYVRKADRARAIDAYKRALQRRPDERIRRACEEQILLLETGRLGSR